MASCSKEDEELRDLFVREIEIESASKKLTIVQHSVGDVGYVVWDAGIVLGKYLDFSRNYGNCKIENKSVIELGSGTGIVGLIAASLGANVTLTDLPELVPLLEKNISSNRRVLSGSISAVPLKWGERHNFGTFDIVLVADCVYYENSVEDLVRTICELSGCDTEVLISYEERSEKEGIMQKFFKLLKRKFVVHNIPYCQQHPHFQSLDIHILKCTVI